jgi:hypothetical protein
MKFCNIISQTKQSSLPKLPNTINETWDNSKSRYMTLGWRECIEGTIPEGTTANPNRRREYIQDENNPEFAIEIIYTETPEETAIREAQQEQERINNKSPELKAAENDFLSLVGYANQMYNIGIVTTDGFKEIQEKIDSSMMERVDKLDIGLKLRNLWDVVLFHGGSWGDVQFHDLSQ